MRPARKEQNPKQYSQYCEWLCDVAGGDAAQVKRPGNSGATPKLGREIQGRGSGVRTATGKGGRPTAHGFGKYFAMICLNAAGV